MKMSRSLIQICLLSAVILPTSVNAQFDFTMNSDGTLVDQDIEAECR